MKKLNIAMVCDPVTDYIAGSYLSTLYFSEILKKRGHKIIFIAARSPINPKDNFWQGIKVYRFPSILLPKTENKVYLGLPTNKRLKKIFHDEKINIVHAVIPTPLAIMAIKAAKALKLKIVAHSHTQAENLFLYWPKVLFRDSLNRLFYKYLAWIYRQSDVLIHPSQFSKEIFSTLNVRTKNIVISNGVNIKKFRKVETTGFLKKYNLAKSTRKILYVGRLHPEKNVDTLIASVPFILKKVPNCHVLIVGSGNMHEPLMKLAHDIGVENNVRFMGRLSDDELVQAYNAADVFVLPSFYELEGMAVLEAMACGKPIVVANSPESASRYFVQGNGYLFEPQKPKDLADKVLKILGGDGLRQSLGAKSFVMSRKFDIEKSVTMLEQVYHSILNDGMKECMSKNGLYYRQNEFKEGRKTLVFVHGLSGSSSAWHPYEDKFKDDFNILTFDLRGHGKSVKPKKYEDYSIENFAEDLKYLLNLAKIKKCILISHSFGTLIALEFLSKRQEKVSAAVFLSPGYCVGKTARERFIKPLVDLAHVLRPLLPLKKSGGHIDYSNFSGSGDWYFPRMVADISNTNLRVYMDCTRQSYKFDREKLLAKINVATLIIHGKEDTIFPFSNSVKMAHSIRKSKLILLPHANHILVLNNFPEVAGAIENFLKKKND